MIPRNVQGALLRLADSYPVVTLTGPRQSGKTTLCRAAFPDLDYVNLELPDVRAQAREDPRAFLDRFRRGAVLDEIQRVPDLFSYIQAVVDEEKRDGMFVLTGSQQFELLDSLTQSLAGRTAIVKLLPFALDEAYATPCPESLDDVLYRGFYPRIHDKHLVPTEALGFYVNTYVERDLRSLLQVRDLAKFDTFLKLLAARTGRILNLSNLANECDVSHNTVKSWISILEASSIVVRVRPHHKNFSKRLIKSPKLYFVDVGLACYLLGIAEPAHVASHPLRGALVETFVVSEILKKRLNSVRDSNLYFYRDSAGHEVDLILDYGSQVVPIEIKASATYSSRQVESLEKYRKLDKAAVREQILVYCGNDSLNFQETRVVSFRDLGQLTV